MSGFQNHIWPKSWSKHTLKNIEHVPEWHGHPVIILLEENHKDMDAFKLVFESVDHILDMPVLCSKNDDIQTFNSWIRKWINLSVSLSFDPWQLTTKAKSRYHHSLKNKNFFAVRNGVSARSRSTLKLSNWLRINWSVSRRCKPGVSNYPV